MLNVFKNFRISLTFLENILGALKILHARLSSYIFIDLL